MHGNKLEGDGTWYWLDVAIDGADIKVSNTPCTWFGGNSDPQDNGETASGVSTRDHPCIMGCALPLARSHGPTTGSPLPQGIPWSTGVRVFCHETHRVIEVELIDLGPAKKTHHGCDLTVAAFAALGIDPSKGVCHVDYRIIGAAKYVGR